MKLKLIAVILLILVTSCPAAVDEKSRAANKATVARLYRERQVKYRNDPNMLVLPGLLANRKEHWVRFQAEATGIGSNDPAEFLLTAEHGEHDYEAIAISFAKPSDIDKALVFIGMPRGKPASPRKLRFWSKGERVIITFEWTAPLPTNQTATATAEGTNSLAKAYSVRAEDLVLDKATGGTAPRTGFTFVGSAMRVDPDDPTKQVYAADAFGPNSIASHYNDPETVLDVPRQAFQNSVYGSQMPNPKYPLTPGQFLNVILTPEPRDGTKCVLDLTFSGKPKNGASSASSLTELDIIISDAQTNVLSKTNTLAGAMAVFQSMSAKKHDVFVTLAIHNDIQLGALNQLCSFLFKLDHNSGIRIEPPLPGDPYYKAFLPTQTLRNRKDRISQPGELRVTETNGKLEYTLILITDKWHADGTRTMTQKNHNVPTPADMKKILQMKDEKGQPIVRPGVFLFAPKTTLYGDVKPFISELVRIEFTVFVYLD